MRGWMANETKQKRVKAETYNDIVSFDLENLKKNELVGFFSWLWYLEKNLPYNMHVYMTNEFVNIQYLSFYFSNVDRCYKKSYLTVTEIVCLNETVWLS